MNIKKIIFLIGLLSIFASCKQNTTNCNTKADEKNLLGVWQTNFKLTEGKGYATFPTLEDQVQTYEYLAFSETGKVYFAVRKIDYKNSSIELKNSEIYDFVADEQTVKLIKDEAEIIKIDYVLYGDGLTIISRDKEGKPSIFDYKRTKAISLVDIENAES